MRTPYIKIAALLLVLAALPLLGTSVPKMDLATLVNASDRILQGKVEAVEVRLDQKLRLPFTSVRVRVDDPLCEKASPGARCKLRSGVAKSTVFLKHVGGKVPNSPYTITVAGTPMFHQGDNVIVFLRDLGDGTDTYQVVGMNQGKYEVIDEVAVAQISGIELIDPRTGKTLPSGFVESAPVEALKAKIRELVK